MRNLPRSLSVAAAVLLLAACTGFPATEFTTIARDPAVPVTRIALGSCAREARPQPIWNAVLAAGPDLFVHLGDNIYGDTEDMRVMQEKYLALWNKPGYRTLRRTVPVIATWDDHDYGENDAGAEYPMKAQSKQAFLDFFGEPKSSERRTRDGGIYTSYRYGPPGKRVQVILLDTRYDRTALTKVPKPDRPKRRSKGMGYYVAERDPAARVLGDDQWAWLERQLRRPAELRIVASSIQVLSDFTGREGWANMPLERERLIAVIRRTGAKGVVFVSGDVHLASISKRTEGAPYPLWELTASALNQISRISSPNRNRVAGPYTRPNFGMIEIDWDRADPEVRLEIHDIHGKPVIERRISISSLSSG